MSATFFLQKLPMILQKLPIIIFFVISSIIIYQLASLTWFLLPFDKSTPVWILPKANRKFNKLNSATVITSKNIFGHAKEARFNKPPNAPLTKLNLELVGLVSASNPLYSSAILDNAGEQTSYFVGSEIKGTSATISSILFDRLILDVNGTMQTLLFDKNNTNKYTDPHAQPERIVKLNRQAILNNPSKLTDYIEISPVRKGGKIIGYRVNPGRDKKVFESAGLLPGDIAISINGSDLSDPRQAYAVLKSLPTLHTMSLTVTRAGQLHQLNLDLP